MSTTTLASPLPDGGRGHHAPSPHQETAARLEDIEFLASHGETPENVARRTGFNSRASMERMLWRHGRGDLIARMCSEHYYIPRSARGLGTRTRMSR